MDMKIWICENCSVVPKKTDKIFKKFIGLTAGAEKFEVEC